MEKSMIALFDTDRTLVDFTDIVNAALRETTARVFKVGGDLNDLERHDFSGQSMEHIISALAALKSDYIGRFRDNKVREALALYDLKVQEMLRTHRSPESFVLPGVFNFLDALSSCGVHRGIFSGTVSGIHNIILEVTKLRGYFQSAWTSDLPGIATRVDLIRACYEQITRSQGIIVPADKVVVFGDAPADIRSANEFGARSVGVLRRSLYSSEELEREHPTKIYGSFEQSSQILGELFGSDGNQ